MAEFVQLTWHSCYNIQSSRNTFHASKKSHHLTITENQYVFETRDRNIKTKIAYIILNYRLSIIIKPQY